MSQLNFAVDFIGRTIQYECGACDVARHELLPAGGRIFEDEDVVIYPHLYAPINGIIVIAPKKHINFVTDLDEQLYYKVFDLVNEVKSQLTLLNISDEFTVMSIEGEDEHARVLVMPRFGGVFEKDFDFEFLRSKPSLERRNIPISDARTIMYTTQLLKSYFAKKKND